MPKRAKPHRHRYDEQVSPTSQMYERMYGASLSVILNVPCEDGRLRIAFVQQARLPAHVMVYDFYTQQTHQVPGWLCADKIGYTFEADRHRKNAHLLVPIDELCESFDKDPESFEYDPHDLKRQLHPAG
jgi:hypothetical protein